VGARYTSMHNEVSSGTLIYVLIISFALFEAEAQIDDHVFSETGLRLPKKPASPLWVSGPSDLGRSPAPPPPPSNVAPTVAPAIAPTAAITKH
jgi:hypothetical protein